VLMRLYRLASLGARAFKTSPSGRPWRLRLAINIGDLVVNDQCEWQADASKSALTPAFSVVGARMASDAKFKTLAGYLDRFPVVAEAAPGVAHGDPTLEAKERMMQDHAWTPDFLSPMASLASSSSGAAVAGAGVVAAAVVGGAAAAAGDFNVPEIFDELDEHWYLRVRVGEVAEWPYLFDQSSEARGEGLPEAE